MEITCIDYIKGVLRPPAIGQSPEYLQADEFARTIELDDDTDPDWIWEYAKDMYDRFSRIYRDLDNKSNELIKYISGGIILFTLGLLVSLADKNAWIIKWAFPSYILGLIALAFAVSARQPNPVVLPPSIKDAIDYANFFKNPARSKGAFLGQWHASCVGIRLAVERKSVRVQWATWAFFASIVLLLMPLVRVIL